MLPSDLKTKPLEFLNIEGRTIVHPSQISTKAERIAIAAAQLDSLYQLYFDQLMEKRYAKDGDKSEFHKIAGRLHKIARMIEAVHGEIREE